MRLQCNYYYLIGAFSVSSRCLRRENFHPKFQIPQNQQEGLNEAMQVIDLPSEFKIPQMSRGLDETLGVFIHNSKFEHNQI